MAAYTVVDVRHPGFSEAQVVAVLEWTGRMCRIRSWRYELDRLLTDQNSNVRFMSWAAFRPSSIGTASCGSGVAQQDDHR